MKGFLDYITDEYTNNTRREKKAVHCAGKLELSSTSFKYCKKLCKKDFANGFELETCE